VGKNERRKIMNQERNYGQVECLEEIRSRKPGGCPTRDFIRFVRGTGFDLRMVSQGGFEVDSHLQLCQTCGNFSGKVSAKGY